MIEKTEFTKNNLSNGGIDNNIAKLNTLNDENLNCSIKNNNYVLNILPKTRRILNENKLDKKFTTNSSFLAFRKYNNENPKKIDKKYDNTATINENHINIMSISNMSNSNLLNEKNEIEIRNLMRTPKLKDETIYSGTINKINSIYENNFTLKLKLNHNTNDITNTQSKYKNDKLLTTENAKYNSNTNNVKINNFIIKSRTFNNDLGNSLIFDKHSSKILQRFCFICEVFEEKLYHTKFCTHLFCKKCGRSYFDQLVEKGIYNLKCPKYNCQCNLNLKYIKEILTPDTYQKIQTFMKIDNSKERINNRYQSIDKVSNNDNNLNILKKNMAKLTNHDSFKALIPKKKHSLKSQIPISNRYNYSMHFRVKQHIIKVTDSTKFRIRVKNEKEIKKALCMKCKKSSLFSREDQNFIRCLNCGNVICKYCFKQLGQKNDNSIRKLNTIYAICYNHIKIPSKKSKPKKIIYEILFIVSGFLILWIGFSKYEAKYIINKRKRYFLFIIFFFIFLMTNLVIFILFIPYFPLIISILE
jgi:hypothetical protein